MDAKLKTILPFVVLLSGCASQGDYPNRPLTLICPWAVGGGTDRVSRQVAAQLQQELGQPVNVLNATGGSGVTGHSRGAHAKPDGYTLMMMTVELNMLRHRGLTDLSYEDFTPLALINRDAAALFVRTEAPWQSLGELADAVKEAPGTLTGSGTAKGGIWHLALAGWLQSMDLSTDAVNWIPSTGSAPSLQELAGGGVDMVCCSLPEAQSLLDAEKIRCLGVMANERVTQFPNVPTFIEQGVDWEMGGWRGLGLPNGVDPEKVEVLRKSVEKVVKSDEFLAFMETAGFDARFEGPDEFSESLASADNVLGGLLKQQYSDLSGASYGPMFFPTVAGIVLGTLLIGLGFVTAAESKGSPKETAVKTRVYPTLLVGAVIAFTLAMPTLGFVVTAALFLLISFRCFGVSVATSALVTAILIPAVYQVFVHLLRVPLPRGVVGW